VRAVFDADSITVYQAYAAEIAIPAVAAQTFVAPFKRERMTWIKPSFLWMMYRCGWGTKPGQERILAVRISRAGFEEALSAACLSHFDADLYRDREAWRARKVASPVRIQWDPERTHAGQPLGWRSLQVGIGDAMVDRYLDDWIVELTDLTEHARYLRTVGATDPTLLPPERPYPLPPEIAAAIGATG
jgi:hypothetical protein